MDLFKLHIDVCILDDPGRKLTMNKLIMDIPICIVIMFLND